MILNIESALPATLLEVFRHKRVFNPAGEEVPLHSNVSKEEAVALYESVRTVRPEASLEIGFAQGISTLAILGALHENQRGQHHVIDPFQAEFGNCGRAMVERSGLEDRFAFYESFPEKVVPDLPRLQFAFIDSSHLFDLTLFEFVLTDKRMDVGGVIGFHDMWMSSQQARSSGSSSRTGITKFSRSVNLRIVRVPRGNGASGKSRGLSPSRIGCSPPTSSGHGTNFRCRTLFSSRRRPKTRANGRILRGFEPSG